MDLNILSWNVRGLESPDRKKIVRRFLSHYKSKDVVLLQEIKSTNFSLETNLNFIWRDVVHYTTQHEKGKGREAILISKN
jgi:exonuclease III